MPEQELRSSSAKHELVASICAELLGLPHVDLADNFFDLGGDSLLAARVTVEAAKQGVSFEFRDILEASSIGGIRLRTVPAPTTDWDVPWWTPLTPGQLRVVADWSVRPGSGLAQHLYELAPEISAKKLEGALRRLAGFHTVVTAEVETAGGIWQQRGVRNDRRLPFAHYSLIDGDDEDEAVAVIQQAALALRRELRPDSGFGMGAAYIERAGRSPWLYVAFSELMVDSRSRSILIGDLDDLLRGVLVVDPDAEIPSFFQWAQYLSVGLESVSPRQAAFWRAQAARGSDWPPLSSSPRAASAMAGSVHGDLAWPRAERLAVVLNQASDFTALDVVLTALVRVLAEWSGSPCGCVELEVDARDVELGPTDLEVAPGMAAVLPNFGKTAGQFSSRFPIRLEVPDSEGIRCLKLVKEQLDSVIDCGLSYGKLRYAPDGRLSSGDREATVEPNIRLVMTTGDVRPSATAFRRRVPDRYLGSAEPSVIRAPIIEVEADVSGYRPSCRWTFSTSYYDTPTMAELMHKHIEYIGALSNALAGRADINSGPSRFGMSKLVSRQRFESRLPDIGGVELGVPRPGSEPAV